VKKRNLKRRTSLLKHARFLNNLVVTPKDPPVKEPTKDDEEQNEDEEDNWDIKPFKLYIIKP